MNVNQFNFRLDHEITDPQAITNVLLILRYTKQKPACNES